ncbi:hypothetical protein [Pedobacter caeni]|nr:hypothetical protein [Pedobacter caeni]
MGTKSLNLSIGRFLLIKNQPLEVTGMFLIILLNLMLILSACHSEEDKRRKKQKEELVLPVTGTKMGIGLIHFNTNKPLMLYQSKTDTLPYDSIQFVARKTGLNKGRCDFRTKHLGDKLQPYILSEGDSDADAKSNINMGLIRFVPQLVFRVIDKTDDGVQVLINEKTYETSFVRVNPKKDLRINMDDNGGFFDPNFNQSRIPDWFYYETWEQALKRAAFIDYDPKELYDKPNGKKIQKNETYQLKVDIVQDDWIRFVDNYTEKFHGWTRWKVKDSIIVQITLNGGYE